MGLWEEAFRNICGSMQLRRQGIPQPTLRIAPELIAVVCLWLICCDVNGHCLKLASGQRWCKDMGERLVGLRPRLPCLLLPSAFQTEVGGSFRTHLWSQSYLRFSLLTWGLSCWVDASFIRQGHLSSGSTNSQHLPVCSRGRA